MLKIKNLNVSIGNKTIIDDFNFNINDGEFIAITGPNGSGKTTLAKSIMGLIESSGSIKLDDTEINDLDISSRAKYISYAFQTPVKFKGLKVKDLININSDMDTQEIFYSCKRVGLCPREYMEREVDSSLSGGELKRIEIASIINRKSKVVIFDEPEAGIDLWSFDNLIEVFKELKKEKRILIVISHQEKIINIADKVIILDDGKINTDLKLTRERRYCCEE
jgi:Fe-S cluster assembly ATP-binding protein